jgi:two-component system chemotaxis response regulator CheB
VLIGASTGGVDALLTVLASFPVDCPPTAIVQHTGRGFSDSLIALLDRRCAARVVAAKDGSPLQPGTVCVAAGCDGHLRLLGSGSLRCQVSPGEPVSGHVPSVDELFRSAVPFADRVVAALLTGMGRDGAEGLLALRRKGATTIGQDEASAVVYGMPRAAFELGAVQTQLGLNRIGPEILRHCQPEPDLAAR